MTYTCENCGLELKNRQKLADHICNSDDKIKDLDLEEFEDD